MDGYVAISLVGVVAIFCIVVAFFIFYKSRESRGLKRDENRPLLDYLLVWPLIFRSEYESKRRTSKLFIIVGIIICFVLIVIGLKINHRK